MTRIRGIDFTSAPSRSKPITVAEGALEGTVLRIREIRCLASFDEFDGALREPGPWIAGIDFPFGQPRRLIEDLKWPQDWKGLIAHVADRGKAGFERAIREYTKERSVGDKEHKRATDPSYAISAMHLDNPPAGKMFLEGAPRIAAAEASIVPCVPNGSDRVIVEAYAAMVVKALVRKGSYKSGQRGQADVRRKIALVLSGNLCRERYGLTVEMKAVHREELVKDSAGDLLDAVLCALQAAWALGQPNYGVPDDCDALEGWIVDPLR